MRLRRSSTSVAFRGAAKKVNWKTYYKELPAELVEKCKADVKREMVKALIERYGT